MPTSPSSSPTISISLCPKFEPKSEVLAGEPEIRAPKTSNPPCVDGQAGSYMRIRGIGGRLFRCQEELSSFSSLFSVPKAELCKSGEDNTIKGELEEPPYAGESAPYCKPNCLIPHKQESMALSDLASNTIDYIKMEKQKSSCSSISSSADIGVKSKKRVAGAEVTCHEVATATKRPRLSSVADVEPSPPTTVNNAQNNIAKPSPLIPALNTNLKPRAKRGSANDSQSIAARHRRERINARIKILQGLVPNGSKVDLVTMLENAINYVKGLQYQLQILQNDLYWPNQEKLSELLKSEMLRNRLNLQATSYVMEDASNPSPLQKKCIFVEPEEVKSFIYISQILQQQQFL